MTLTNVSEKWAWSRSCDPVNFWALNANSSKTAKDTNFKFDRHVPGIVATWPLRKVSETLAWPGSRDHDNSTVQTAAMGQTPRSTERILVINNIIVIYWCCCNGLPAGWAFASLVALLDLDIVLFWFWCLCYGKINSLSCDRYVVGKPCGRSCMACSS